MKRLVKGFGLVLLSMLTLTACIGHDHGHLGNQESIVVEGVLTEQQASDAEPGTHFITKDSGEKLAVNSLELNLSDVAYLDNKVSATGIMDAETEIFRVSGLSIIEVLSEVKAEVARFKEYENEELGFKIKYYDDWSIDNDEEKVVFTAPNSEDSDEEITSEVTVSQSMFSYSPEIEEETGEQDSALEAYVSEAHPSLLADIDSYMNRVGPEQIEAVKLEEKAGAVYYYVYRFGLVYEISFVPGEDMRKANEDLEQFDEMLSEFSFMPFEVHTDKDGEEEMAEFMEETMPDTEDLLAELNNIPELDIKLTTFESLPYSFRGKYPASWYYAGSRSNEAGVLHHYGFSDEEVEETNELVSLDVLAENPKGGSGISTETKIAAGIKIFFAYVTVDGQHYRFSGPIEYQDTITVMAYSIESLDEE